MSKKSYLGGSTTVKKGSDWFGYSETDPADFGPETADEAFLRGPKRYAAPEIPDREEYLENKRKRSAEKKARRRGKKKVKLTKEEKILNKYQDVDALLFGSKQEIE